MDERLAATVRNLSAVSGVRQFGFNARAKGILTDDLQAALNERAGELMLPEVAEKLGVSSAELSSAELKLLQVVGEYVAIKSLFESVFSMCCVFRAASAAPIRARRSR